MDRHEKWSYIHDESSAISGHGLFKQEAVMLIASSVLLDEDIRSLDPARSESSNKIALEAPTPQLNQPAPQEEHHI
jgi:hypothetical protein